MPDGGLIEIKELVKEVVKRLSEGGKIEKEDRTEHKNAEKKLVETIVKEVVKRLNKGGKVEKEDGTDHKNADSKEILLVFTGGNLDINLLNEQVKTFLSGYKLKALFTEAARRMLDCDKMKKMLDFRVVVEDEIYAEMSKVVAVIFPNLTQNTMIKASMGIRDSIGSEAMAIAIMLGKPVIAAKDSIPIKSMPALYGNMCEEAIKKLSFFGVDICTLKEIGRRLTSMLANKQGNSSQLEQQPDKKGLDQKGLDDEVLNAEKKPEPSKGFKAKDVKVITGEFINAILQKGHTKVFIPISAVVTPLARDIARDKGIDLLQTDMDGEGNEVM